MLFNKLVLRRMLIFVISFYAFQDSYGQQFAEFSLMNLKHDSIETVSLLGRKTIVMILPMSDPNNQMKKDLFALLKRAKGIQIILIPSYEDGFKKSMENSIKDRFPEDSLGLFITGGMFTHKTSGEQNELFKWLTDKSKNNRFDLDVTGAGQLFFIDENGELYAALASDVNLKDPFLERILARK